MRERGHDKYAAVSEEPAPVVVGDLNPAEMRAADVGDTVVLREPLVDERVVRGQQIEHASIFAENAACDELRFTAEALAEVLVEILISLRIGEYGRQVPEKQPLADEIRDERVGARIRQHPADLLFQDFRIAKLAAAGHFEQLVVRDAAPQKERQPGGKLEVADAIDRRSAIVHRRLALYSEQELGAHQQPFDRALYGDLEIFFRARLLIYGEERLNIRFGNRPSERAPRKRRKDRFRAPIFIIRLGRAGTRKFARGSACFPGPLFQEAR